MKISFEMNDEAYAAMEQFAAEQDISVSEFIRRVLLERLEDEEDIKAADKAMAEYKANPVSYPANEVWQRLGV